MIIYFVLGGKIGNGQEEEDEETSEDETSEEEENIKMSKEEYKLHKKEEAKNQKNKYFKKNQKIKMKKQDWDKWYQGGILEVKEVKPNPLYNTYDIELYGDEWKTQENIKGKYIEAILEEEFDNEQVLEELKVLLNSRKTKGKKSMMKHFETLSKAHEKKQLKVTKKKEEKIKAKNVSKLRKLLRTPNIMNDFKYFKTMSIEEQKKIIKQLKDVNNYSKVEKPYRLQLLNSDIPVHFQSTTEMIRLRISIISKRRC